jgi:hypothetical protein
MQLSSRTITFERATFDATPTHGKPSFNFRDHFSPKIDDFEGAGILPIYKDRADGKWKVIFQVRLPSEADKAKPDTYTSLEYGGGWQCDVDNGIPFKTAVREFFEEAGYPVVVDNIVTRLVPLYVLQPISKKMICSHGIILTDEEVARFYTASQIIQEWPEGQVRDLSQITGSFVTTTVKTRYLKDVVEPEITRTVDIGTRKSVQAFVSVAYDALDEYLALLQKRIALDTVAFEDEKRAQLCAIDDSLSVELSLPQLIASAAASEKFASPDNQKVLTLAKRGWNPMESAKLLGHALKGTVLSDTELDIYVANEAPTRKRYSKNDIVELPIRGFCGIVLLDMAKKIKQMTEDQ